LLLRKKSSLHDNLTFATSDGEKGSASCCLVVEDSQVIRKMLVRQLQNQGLTVHVAVDGKDGLQKMKENLGLYSFVITDLEMPNMNGHEMVSAFHLWETGAGGKGTSEGVPVHTARRLAYEHPLPIFSMSANPEKQDELRNNEESRAMYQGFIAKPVTLEKLSNVVFQYRFPSSAGTSGTVGRT